MIANSYIYIFIIIVLFYIFFSRKTNPTINLIQSQLDHILKLMNTNIDYSIQESNYYSYTKNKKDISLVTNLNNQSFTNQTLIMVAIHELAHILSKSNQHTTEFYDIEKILIDKAIKLNYILPDEKIDPNYPCIT